MKVLWFLGQQNTSGVVQENDKELHAVQFLWEKHYYLILTKLHTILIVRARQSLLSEPWRISTMRFVFSPRPGVCGLIVPGRLFFYCVLFIQCLYVKEPVCWQGMCAVSPWMSPPSQRYCQGSGCWKLSGSWQSCWC